jgi:hypothetical protein
MASLFQGKRAFFLLDTPNRAAAAAKARDIFLFLTVNGWPLRLRGIRRGLNRRQPNSFIQSLKIRLAEVQVDPEGLSVEEPGDGTELEVSEDPVIQQLFD